MMVDAVFGNKIICHFSLDQPATWTKILLRFCLSDIKTIKTDLSFLQVGLNISYFAENLEYAEMIRKLTHSSYIVK